jgi:hypothetical protein
VPTSLLAVLAWYAILDSLAKVYFLKGRDRGIAIELSLYQPGDRETTGLQWRQGWGALLGYRSEHLRPDLPQSLSLNSSSRLLTVVDVLRMQRLLRVFAPFRPDHHIGDGRIHFHPVQRSLRSHHTFYAGS